MVKEEASELLRVIFSIPFLLTNLLLLSTEPLSLDHKLLVQDKVLPQKS